MTTTPTTRRPVLVTVLVVLVVLSGIGAAVSAWIILTSTGAAVWGGIVQILVALAYLAVAKGLWDGNPTARFAAAAVAVVQIVLALLVNVIAANASGGASVRTVGIVFPVLVLIVLFTPKANAFFGSRR